jgi:DNA mismatch repair protein MutS2
VGDLVEIRGGGKGRLLSLPDTRGRVAVGVGSARLVVNMELVGPAPAGPTTPAKPAALHRDTLARLADARDEGSQRCDLRGLRVDEALSRLAEALDRAAAQGSASLAIVHGIGTGALRDAVRRHLKESPYVDRFGPGEPGEGGEGVTLARLEPATAR